MKSEILCQTLHKDRRLINILLYRLLNLTYLTTWFYYSLNAIPRVSKFLVVFFMYYFLFSYDTRETGTVYTFLNIRTSKSLICYRCYIK